MHLDSRFPARSIPNLPNESCSMVQPIEPYHLARSSSHPPEMWGRELIDESQATDPDHFTTVAVITEATQTDNKIDMAAMKSFILANPRLVLNILGIIDPAYQFECELQPATLNPIPETDLISPSVVGPVERLSMDKTMASAAGVWRTRNSNSKSIETCGSTDALLATVSEDNLLRSDENLSCDSLGPTLEPINFSIVREMDRKPSKTSSLDASRSSNSNSISSLGGGSHRGSINDLLTPRPQMGVSSSGLHKKSLWQDSNNTLSRQMASEQMTSMDSEPRDQPTASSDFDNLSDFCVFLSNDIRKPPAQQSSSQDLQKRNNCLPRPPINHRFSAGDADKLEKGIKHIPSTRSLKEN